MAYNKEATVVVLDVGAGMKEVVDGKMSALEISTMCITRMMHNKLFTESKDEFALVFFGTEDTENRLNSDVNPERYENIRTEHGLKLINWDMLESVVKQEEPTKIHGDVFDGLRVALDIIEQDAAASKRKRFASRRIVLFSNLKSATSASASQVETFATDLKIADIGLLQLIGCDLDAESAAPLKKEKAHGKHSKASNDSVQMMSLCFEKLISFKVLDAKECYSYADALAYSTNFTTRVVRPTPWKGVLELGESLKIPVMAFSKVKIAAPKQNWKKAIAQDPGNTIQKSVEYFVQRGLHREEVDKNDVIDAYKYGSTLVPFSHEDKLSMKFMNIGKGLKVLGFASASEVKGHLYVGNDVKIMTAPTDDEAAQTAISALANALVKEKAVVIARFGYNAISAPKLVSLSPYIDEKENIEGLYFHYLPFADDVRLYTFASLTDDQKEQQQPSDKQLAAFDAYIEHLTLNENDEEFQTVSPEQINSPYLQRLYHSLQFRALHPDDPLPPLDESFLDKLRMPDRLVKLSKKDVEKLKELFPLKKIEPKKRFKKDDVFEDGAEAAGDAGANQAAADVDVPAPQEVKTIGTIMPAEDFRAMVFKADDEVFKNAIKKASAVINQLIFKTFEGSVYADKVINLGSAMREECVKRDSADLFNNFLKSFKDELLEKNHDEVWNKVVTRDLNLITKNVAASSTVTGHQADEFLKSRKVIQKEKKAVPVAPAEDDMFDEMFS